MSGIDYPKDPNRTLTENYGVVTATIAKSPFAILRIFPVF